MPRGILRETGRIESSHGQSVDAVFWEVMIRSAWPEENSEACKWRHGRDSIVTDRNRCAIRWPYTCHWFRCQWPVPSSLSKGPVENLDRQTAKQDGRLRNLYSSLAVGESYLAFRSMRLLWEFRQILFIHGHPRVLIKPRVSRPESPATFKQHIQLHSHLNLFTKRLTGVVAFSHTSSIIHEPLNLYFENDNYFHAVL